MLKIENTKVVGWEEAIRGMRNPMNSWDKSDSYATHIEDAETLETAQFEFFVGDNDISLMRKLAASGPVHAKYRRMIVVYLDILAPLYWWKEFDTYKVGTVANSCSTMHKIAAKEFTLEDFSCEHLIDRESVELIEEHCDDFLEECCITGSDPDSEVLYYPLDAMLFTIKMLNTSRDLYLQTNDKRYWWQMIQLLPSSYNQRRTVMLSYEVLANIYKYRRDHKLDEWHTFCDWIESLPHSELITGDNKND